MTIRNRYSFEIVIFSVFFILGLFYVGNAWSPSSYGIFLQQHDPENTGIIWGEPRAIRSDEWAVVTPLTQATVNNNFKRYNKASFYQEDLRINYGLPIYDWGLFFKPTMWGYLFLRPAMAYSLNWYLVFVLFIVGYFKLFNSIGFGRLLSLSVSITLYFSTFSQFWWNEKGPVIAFFPWIVYLLVAKFKPVPALLLFYWLSVSWLITNFYPPVVISLGFVGVVLFICYGNHWFTVKRIAALVITTIAAVATTLLYLRDYLIKTSQTLYPGHRSISGGSLSWHDWLSQFFPFSTFDKKFEVFNQSNISEIGAVGVPFLIMVLVHLNIKNFVVQTTSQKERLNLFICFIALLLMTLWMLAPVPSWIGKVFMWDNVHPVRMKYAAGIMLTIVTLAFSQYFNYVLSAWRFFSYCLIIIAGWFLTKLNYANVKIDSNFFDNIHNLCRDLYFIPAMAAAYLMVKYLKFTPVTAFVFCSALVSAIVIFPFNPLQSAEAIFGPHEKIKKELDLYVNSSNNVLAISGYPGATLNGLGYKSVTHVTAVPALSIWEKIFPNMEHDRFQHVFNRYSHIHLTNISEPTSPQPDVVDVPYSAFVSRFFIPKKNDWTVFTLNSGAVMSGTLTDLPEGRLTGFSPLVGNYFNTAKGILEVKICNSGICQKASIDLSETTDNAYAPLFLSAPVFIIQGSATTYEFQLSKTDGSVALWASQTTTNNRIMEKNTARVINLMPNLEVSYEK